MAALHQRDEVPAVNCAALDPKTGERVRGDDPAAGGLCGLAGQRQVVVPALGRDGLALQIPGIAPALRSTRCWMRASSLLMTARPAKRPGNCGTAPLHARYRPQVAPTGERVFGGSGVSRRVAREGGEADASDAANYGHPDAMTLDARARTLGLARPPPATRACPYRPTSTPHPRQAESNTITRAQQSHGARRVLHMVWSNVGERRYAVAEMPSVGVAVAPSRPLTGVRLLVFGVCRGYCVGCE